MFAVLVVYFVVGYLNLLFVNALGSVDRRRNHETKGKNDNEKDRPKTVSLLGALFKACKALIRIPRHQRKYY